MATDSTDVIGQVRTAEAEAQATIASESEDRRRRVAEAESAAQKSVIEIQARLRRQAAEARERAEQDASALLENSAKESEKAAAGLGRVPDERRERAVALVVESLKDQWRSKESSKS